MHNRSHRKGGTEETGWPSFIAGALIGGGVALILAPQSGTKLRGMLCNYASRATDDLLERTEGAYDKGDEVIRDAGQSAREFATQTRDMAREPGRSAL